MKHTKAIKAGIEHYQHPYGRIPGMYHTPQGNYSLPVDTQARIKAKAQEKRDRKAEKLWDDYTECLVNNYCVSVEQYGKLTGQTIENLFHA